MFLKTFIHETMLSAIFQKSASSGAEGFRSLGSLPFSEEPKRIRQKSLGSLPKTEWPKEWAFIKSDLKSAKSTVFGSREPKEWDFIFYELYSFQKMPKRIRPLFLLLNFASRSQLSSQLYFWFSVPD